MVPKKGFFLTECQRTFFILSYYLPLGKAFKKVLCQVWLKLTYFGENYDKDTSWVFSPILQILPLERMVWALELNKLQIPWAKRSFVASWIEIGPVANHSCPLSFVFPNIECDNEWNLVGHGECIFPIIKWAFILFTEHSSIASIYITVSEMN